MVTVVGVSRDVPGFRFSDVRRPDIFVPTSVDAQKALIVARVNGDPDLARQTLIDHLTRIDPNMGAIMTIRSLARLETFLLGIAFWVSLILGGLALVLTVSGLFSVLSYLVAQRTREIGVRLALGASARQVTHLILSQTTRPVLYGLLAGAGLAATLATALIATPVRRLHLRDRARDRSSGVCGQPDRDHHRLPGRRLDPRHARGSRRSDADAAPGITAHRIACGRLRRGSPRRRTSSHQATCLCPARVARRGIAILASDFSAEARSSRRRAWCTRRRRASRQPSGVPPPRGARDR